MSYVSNKYFSTGEFAKLFGVHKKTLFHYDEIGLFHPDKVLENGYRYYSAAQVELFDTILQLKHIGMPLKDIKHFINHRTPEMVIDLFTTERAQIEAQIQSLEALKYSLNIKTQLLQSALNMPSDITLEHQEEEFLVISNQIQPTDSEYDIHTYTEHLKYCTSHKLNIGYPVGAMLALENIYNGNFYDLDYYFTKTNSLLSEHSFIKPAGCYVVGYLKGFYDKTPLLYNKLLAFSKKHSLTLEGYAYEQLLIDQLAVQDPEEMVTKISIKVATP